MHHRTSAHSFLQIFLSTFNVEQPHPSPATWTASSLARVRPCETSVASGRNWEWASGILTESARVPLNHNVHLYLYSYTPPACLDYCVLRIVGDMRVMDWWCILMLVQSTGYREIMDKERLGDEAHLRWWPPFICQGKGRSDPAPSVNYGPRVTTSN